MNSWVAHGAANIASSSSRPASFVSDRAERNHPRGARLLTDLAITAACSVCRRLRRLLPFSRVAARCQLPAADSEWVGGPEGSWRLGRRSRDSRCGGGRAPRFARTGHQDDPDKVMQGAPNDITQPRALSHTTCTECALGERVKHVFLPRGLRRCRKSNKSGYKSSP